MKVSGGIASRMRFIAPLALALVLIVVAGVACNRTSEEPAAPVAASHGAASAFGLYVLALSWAPSFCCAHAGKEECAGLDAAFAGTHLTLHGLWPNYTDDEARAHGDAYPQFCGEYASCQSGDGDRKCRPDPSSLPDEMKTLGPGYVGDHDFLADHEWPKHGSCTNLAAADYFRSALNAMKSLPGEGTPNAVRSSIGGDIALADLEGAFGVPKGSVLLSCDARCRLQQVSFCLAHDVNNRPTTPTACPANTTKAQYDNGCVTRGCQRVAIPTANKCESSSSSSSSSSRPPPPSSGACSHPGQGPPCTGDAMCTKAGFARCARSGCCTNQPK
jgi:ribonuclease T2